MLFDSPTQIDKQARTQAKKNPSKKRDLEATSIASNGNRHACFEIYPNRQNQTRKRCSSVRKLSRKGSFAPKKLLSGEASLPTKHKTSKLGDL